MSTHSSRPRPAGREPDGAYAPSAREREPAHPADRDTLVGRDREHSVSQGSACDREASQPYRSPQQDWQGPRRREPPAPAGPSPGKAHRRPEHLPGRPSASRSPAAKLPEPPVKPAAPAAGQPGATTAAGQSTSAAPAAAASGQPGSAAPGATAQSRPAAAVLGGSGLFMEELRKAAMAAASKQQESQAVRKHSPIVWAQPRDRPARASDSPGSPEEGLIQTSPPPAAFAAAPAAGSPPAAASARPLTAAEKAAQELASFQQRREQDDVDPDAPAALRASPSASDDPGERLSAARAPCCALPWHAQRQGSTSSRLFATFPRHCFIL